MLADSKHYFYEGVEFWAHGGLVRLVDCEAAGNSQIAPDDAVKAISPGDMIKRAIAIRAFVGDRYPDEAFAARQFLERAVEVAKRAKAQGDPTDPQVLNHVANHYRRSQVSMALPPLGGRRLRLKFGNPRDVLLGGVQTEQVRPDLILPFDKIPKSARVAKER